MVGVMRRKKSDCEGRFSMRLSSELLELIDNECLKRVGCVSRNTWIAEAIAEKLERLTATPHASNSDDKAA